MKEVLYSVENGIAVLSIYRPKALNALSREIVDEIDRIAEEISRDSKIRALIIYSDSNFAAGADIGGMVECNEEEARAFAFSPTFNKIEALEIPTIAAIEGYALGGGMELALACDLRIASENAKMGFPEITLGIMPGAGGTVRTTKLAGIAKAKELILMGGTISAQKAEMMGLVNLIAEDGSVFAVAMKWAQKITKMAPIALKTAKRTINEAAHCLNVLDGIEIEAQNWAALFNTEDQKEGMRAFLEKRKPIYSGK